MSNDEMRLAIPAVVMSLLMTTGCALFSKEGLDDQAAEKNDVRAAYELYHRGAYDQAIVLVTQALQQAPDRNPAEAHWLLAQAYEGKGDTGAALREYKFLRSNFPQTAQGTEALDRIQMLELKTPPQESPQSVVSAQGYRLGEDDEVDISVYGDPELSKVQTVRPDGKLAVPLIGDVVAAGLTPDELREQIAQRLSRYVKNPRVNVVVSKYNSKQIYVLGQVRTPGVISLSADIRVLQGIARAGGMTEDADLQGSLLVREGQVVPVNFHRLLRNGDFTQNVALHPNDAILVPNIAARKVFILGEVKQPVAITLRHPVSIIEALAMAGGLTRDAEPKSVAIIRGGLNSKDTLIVNVNDITDRSLTAKNVMLQPNDMIYVPTSFIADVDRFFEHLIKVVSPLVLAEFGIALGPTVADVITKGRAATTTPIIVQPNPFVIR